MADTRLKLEVIMAAVDRITGPLKAIMGGTQRMAEGMRAARLAVKGLEEQQSKLDKYNKAHTSAHDSRDAYYKQKDALDALTKKLEDSRATQQKMVGTFAQAKAEHKELMAAYARNDAVPGLSNKLYVAKQNLEKVAAEYGKVQNATKRFKGELSDATAQLEKAKNSKNNYYEALKRTSGALKETGVDIRKLATYQEQLKAKTLEATNAAEKQGKAMEKLHAAQARYTKTKELAGKLAMGGAKAGAAGAAIGAATSVPVIAFANAEEAATNLKVAMMGVGGVVPDTYKKVSDLATQLGNKLPGTTADFMNMMTMLQRQGLPAEKVLNGVGEATAYLAVQLKKTPEAAAEFAAKMQDATRTADKDMLGLMDTIQRAYYLGVDDNNMLQGFSKLSPALSILRKEGAAAAKELAPLLVMSDQAGMAGEAAGNAYRKIFQMAMGTKKISKANAALEGTGVKLDFTDGKGEFAGLDHMLSQLSRLKNVATQKRLHALKEAFGDDAETLQALTLMIEKGQSGYADVAARMQRQADIQQRVNAQLGTLKNLWDAASGTFTNAMAAFGEAISPELKATTVWLGSMSERLQKWASDNPQLAGTLMTVVKWVGLALIALGGLAVVFSAIIVPMAAVKFAMVTMGLQGFGVVALFAKLSGAVMWLWRAGTILVRNNPILAAVIGISFALHDLYSRFEQLKTLWNASEWTQLAAAIWQGIEVGLNGATLGLYGVIKTIALGLWSTFKSVLGINSPSKVFAELGGFIVDGLIDGLTSKLASLKDSVIGMATSVATWFKEKLGIHSPSRLFAEFGNFTVQGFTQGIDDNQKTPLAAVQNMAAKLAAIGAGITIGTGAMAMPIDTRPPLSAATMGNSSAAIAPNITINIYAQPGQDEQTLARFVALEIEKASRKTQVASRSRLIDSN